MRNLKLSIDIKHSINRFLFIISIMLVSQIAKAIKSFTHVDRPTLHIVVKAKGATITDTLILVMDTQSSGYINAADVKKYSATLNHKQEYEFNVDYPGNYGYMKLLKAQSNAKKVNYKSLSSTYFWEKGDSIYFELQDLTKIAGEQYLASISGKGSKKYRTWQLVNTYLPPTPVIKTHARYVVFDKTNRNSRLAILRENNEGMSLLSQKVLEADICLENSFGAYSVFRDYLVASKNISKGELISKCKEIFALDYIIPIDSNIAAISRSIMHQFYYLKTQSLIYFGKDKPTWIYEKIKENYTGALRDRLIVYQFAFSRGGNATDSLFKDALLTVQNEVAANQLRVLDNLYAKKPFGNYVVTDTAGKNFDLSALKGKIILIDVWFTGCGACSNYFKDVLSEVEEYFKDDKEIAFVSISMDQQRKRWMHGINSGLYTSAHNPYNFLVNIDHPFIKENNITGAPTVMLINKNGEINKYNSVDLYQKKLLIKAINSLK